ncbi:MAG: hypothetical protein ACW99A_23715 [Candidatus Kariarchaeaceae archaeon]|jgi:hypothetical protein
MSKKIEKSKLVFKEVEDLAYRLNEVELELVDAKEFSHLSSEAFLVLQNQITELKELIESIIVPNTTEVDSSVGVYF